LVASLIVDASGQKVTAATKSLRIGRTIIVADEEVLDGFPDSLVLRSRIATRSAGAQILADDANIVVV
jgi:hypothetical protein